MPEERLRNDFPMGWAYLLENRKLLSNREHGKFKETGWYQLYPKNLDFWEQPNCMLSYMITRLSAYCDIENNYYFVNVTTGGFGMTIRNGSASLQFITGLLNSKLLNWFMKQVSTTFHGGYFAANKQFLVQLPIVDLTSNSSKIIQVTSLVERMLELHKQLAAAQTPPEKVRLGMQIELTDRAIDRLVYELYGLTEEEIRVVEGG